jgi:hypothetical protein
LRSQLIRLGAFAPGVHRNNSGVRVMGDSEGRGCEHALCGTVYALYLCIWVS